MPLNVAFVSIAFPPKQDPECLQVAKYHKYLVQEDINTFVITSVVPTLNMTYDASLEKYDKGYVQKLEYKIRENKYLNYLIRKLDSARLQTPDSKKKFIKNWQKIVRDLSQPPDLIYSRSFPLSSALTALQLKKHYRVPWIMHLSDPWADAPWTSPNPAIYNKNKVLEQACFATADKICFTTDKTAAFYVLLYPEYAHKYEIFPNVYDAADVAENPINAQPLNRLRIVYTGGLSGNRGPIHIINVIEHLRMEGFDVDNNIELVLAGDMDRKNKAVLEANSHPYINYLGRKTYQEAKDLQRSAHLLLSIDEPIKDVSKSMFFPSKILDYLMAKRQIVAITPKDSQVYGTFKKFGWPCFTHSELVAGANFLKHAYEQLSHPESFVQIELPEYFDAKKNARRLALLMKSV